MRAEPVNTSSSAASTAIVARLKALKLFGMAHAVAELAAQGAPAFDAAQPMLGQLLKAETAEREVRSVGYPREHPGLAPHRPGLDLLASRESILNRGRAAITILSS